MRHCVRVCTPLRLLLLLCVLLVSVATMPPQRSTAAPAQQDLAPFLGFYSPNTTIALRGEELWFSRPPYESPLVPIGDGLYGFTQGWLEGRALHFAFNDAGSTSLMLLGEDGNWHEFARSGSAYPHFDPSLAAALEQMLEQTTAEFGIPGALLSVHVPWQGGWASARGVSERQRGIPMVPNDHFRIASITKTFVATVALQLVQEGSLDLDQTVAHWLPGMVPHSETMTIRMLLNHTSGVYNYLDDRFMSSVLATPDRVWAPQELVSYAVQRRPAFAPGQPGRWQYSNTNYVLLGLIIERATNTPLSVEIRNRIITPVGLWDTFFEPQESTIGGLAHGYSASGHRDYTYVNLSFAWGVGNMVSTSEDLGRFAQALFAGELLQPHMQHLMLELAGTGGAWGQPALGYGLGVMQDRLHLAPRADGQPRSEMGSIVRGHTGGLLGYRSAMWYMPEYGITVVVSANQMAVNPNVLAERAFNIILAHYGL